MSREFTGDEIRALLAELGRRLRDRGIDADLKLVGGAAVAFTGSHRRTTKDVDASYAPSEAVDAVAAEMADDLGLPQGWLNSPSTAWIPRNATWTEIDLDAPIRVQVATPETLLAMKLNRGEDRDLQDIRHLMLTLGISSPEAAAEIAASKYGDDDIAFTGLAREDAVIIAAEAIERFGER